MTKTQKRDVAKAQQAYQTAMLKAVDDPQRNALFDEYNALVQFVAWSHSIDLDDAYALVEDGPLV